MGNIQGRPTVKVVDVKFLDNAVICNDQGRIIANGPQQDMTFIRRRWSDGMYDVIDADTLQIVVPKHDPEDDKWAYLCIHCGKDPYNEQTK